MNRFTLFKVVNFLYFHGAPHLTTAPSFSDLHFSFATITKFPQGKTPEFYTLTHSMMSHFSSLLTAALGSCTDQQDAGLGYSSRGGEQTPAKRSCWSTGGVTARHFTSPPSHRADLPTQPLPFHCTKWGAASQSHGSHCTPQGRHRLWTGWSMQWYRLPTSMHFFSITGLHEFFKPTLTYANATKICTANICQGEGNRPSLCLVLCPGTAGSVLVHWQKLVAFLKKQLETLKPSRTPRLPPAEDLSATQLQGRDSESYLIHSP